MTIAVTLKVNDGVILASDSASTLSATDPQGNVGVANVYDNANKCFNLFKGFPIGAVTWGAGSIGVASIETLMKDLRKRFLESQDAHWRVDPRNYRVEDVAQLVKEFFYDELYLPTFGGWAPENQPQLGFFIVGYSSGEGMAEEYRIDIGNQVCNGPTLIRDRDVTGMACSGMPEAICRLLNGYSPALSLVLEQRLQVEPAEIQPAMQIITESLGVPIIQPPMPIQDAIDLAEFLVDLTIKFTRFLPGAPSVGGPIEIAAITKHEGFKWIRRKHYYNAELNPRSEHDH